VKLTEQKSNPDRGACCSRKKAASPVIRRRHLEDGQSADGKKLPALAGESDFAPNLTRLALKLGTPSGQPETAGNGWSRGCSILPPTIRGRRCRPCNCDETPTRSPAGCSARRLNGANSPPVAPAETGTLKDMAKIYLEKVLTKSETPRSWKTVLPTSGFKGFAPDADERELAAPLDDGKLKLYVGKKAIGTWLLRLPQYPRLPERQRSAPTHEWGKKDADRLAFEIRRPLSKSTSTSSSAATIPRTSPNRRRLKADARSPAVREVLPRACWTTITAARGFLSLKLAEPRELRLQAHQNLDDRLRMPQFKSPTSSAWPTRPTSSSVAEDERSSRGRDAVMTFILAWSGTDSGEVR